MLSPKSLDAFRMWYHRRISPLRPIVHIYYINQWKESEDYSGWLKEVFEEVFNEVSEKPPKVTTALVWANHIGYVVHQLGYEFTPHEMTAMMMECREQEVLRSQEVFWSLEEIQSAIQEMKI